MSNLFYKYYDSLFEQKNYRKEVSDCLKLYKRYCKLPLYSMIEIGCGTGNHTQEFIKTIPKITALDIDKQMLSLAENKLAAQNKKVTFKLSRIEDINNKVPLIAALFNVVSYIEDFKKLEMFFKGVSKNLQTGGMFIFDAWNGVAAIRSLPQTKTTKIKINDLKIHATLTPVSNLLKQHVLIKYELKEFQGKDCLRKETFQFQHKLWTPYEITEYAKKYQLQTIKTVPLNALNRNAAVDDWKIVYILKKIG